MLSSKIKKGNSKAIIAVSSMVPGRIILTLIRVNFCMKIQYNMVYINQD